MQTTQVVLLHGFGETSDIWETLVPKLLPTCNYIRFDYSKITFCTTIEEYADWLHSKIDENNITRFVLIGHSMGGYIAMAYAEKYGNYLSGLCLFHSTSYEDSEAKKDIRAKTVKFIEKHGTAEFIEDFLPNMYNEDFKRRNKVYIEKQLTDNKQLPAEALIVATKAMALRPDRRAVLKSLDIPCLMIIGGKDKFVNYESSIEQISLLKNPFVLILHHIAHAGMVESPDSCAAIINEFLEVCD